jgi:hypothetical protein
MSQWRSPLHEPRRGCVRCVDDFCVPSKAFALAGLEAGVEHVEALVVANHSKRVQEGDDAQKMP